MNFFEAGIGPKQIVRALQWFVGIPIVYSFVIALLEPLVDGVDLPNPVLALVLQLTGWHGPSGEWWGHVVLAGFALVIELTDRIVVKNDAEYEQRVHEIVKAIGDRLRAGSAVETAVAEAIRTTKGPSSVFQHAIDLCDSMPFDAALREAADQCGSEYLKEVCYLVAEAVSSEGDTGSAIRRLGMELERNQMYFNSIVSKIATPMAVLRGVGLFAVPPLYALLRAATNGFPGGPPSESLEPGATLFFTYGAVGITVYDGLIFGQWDRLFARMPFAMGAVYVGLTWIS